LDLGPTAVDPLAVEAVVVMDQDLDQVAVDHQAVVPLGTVGDWLRFWELAAQILWTCPGIVAARGIVASPGIVAGSGIVASLGIVASPGIAASLGIVAGPGNQRVTEREINDNMTYNG